MKRRRMDGLALRVGAISACAAVASAQSLFQQPTRDSGLGSAPPRIVAPRAGADDEEAKINPVAELEGISLYAIQPSSARQFRPHDLITIIVNQSSKIEHNQKDDLKKSYNNTAGLEAFPDLMKLLEFRLEAGDRTGGSPSGLPELDVSSNSKFKGDSKIDREDRITARLTAEVLEVKPNGNLVLEARSTQITNKEEQTMILTGVCRSEDVTLQNTVQSTQLSDLRLETHHKGDVKDNATKGWIPRILETIFNF